MDKLSQAAAVVIDWEAPSHQPGTPIKARCYCESTKIRTYCAVVTHRKMTYVLLLRVLLVLLLLLARFSGQIMSPSTRCETFLL